jgi:hypothetical protein
MFLPSARFYAASADEPAGPGFSPLGQMKAFTTGDATDIVHRNMNVKIVLRRIDWMGKSPPLRVADRSHFNGSVTAPS